MTRFTRQILVASNAIGTIVNEVSFLVIFCLNCIRRIRVSTSKENVLLFDHHYGGGGGGVSINNTYYIIFSKVLCFSLLFNPTPCEDSLMQIDCGNPATYPKLAYVTNGTIHYIYDVLTLIATLIFNNQLWYFQLFEILATTRDSVCAYAIVF